MARKKKKARKARHHKRQKGVSAKSKIEGAIKLLRSAKTQC